MTDKINDKKLESMKGEPLNPQDEELMDGSLCGSRHHHSSSLSGMGADSGMAFLYEDRFPPLWFACPYACGRFHRPLSESPDGAGWHRCPHHGLGI